MKTDSRFVSVFAALSILFLMQVVFILLPDGLLTSFNLVVRPALYASVTAAIYMITGRDKRPVLKVPESVMVAVIGCILYFLVMLTAGMMFGFAKNSIAPRNFSAIPEYIWIYAAVAFIAEILRNKLIKGAPVADRNAVAVIVTLVYTFVQLDMIRSVGGNLISLDFMGLLQFFLTTAFPVLMLNTLLTYIAFEGALAAMLIIRGTYSQSQIFLPFLPNISMVAGSILIYALLFIMFIFYHRNISDRSRQAHRILKRQSKYQKKPIYDYIIPVILPLFLLLFFLRVFIYFPVVVVTDSMKGAIDRGSVVFVEKVHPEKVFYVIEQGDVIHYKYKNVEMMHRVIEFRYNDSGERIYITRGDANPTADINPVEQDQVLGVARTKISHIGHPVIVIKEIFTR